MGNVLRVLIIEDSDNDAAILERELRKGGFDLYPRRVYSAEQMCQALQEDIWDVVLSEYMISGFSALEALKVLKENGKDLPFIIVSGKAEEETAVCAMKAGAHDFINKGKLAKLVPVVSRELNDAEVRIKHRAAELDRIQSEEKYRYLVESITDVFFALDMELRCTFWNKAAEKLTGIPVKSALTRKFMELFPEHESVSDLLRAALRSRKPFFSKLTTEKEDCISYFEMNAFPTEHGLSVLLRDVTERKRAEILNYEQLEMKRQLSQTQEIRLLGLLTSGVAHEVRNPLNAISVVLEALFQEIGDNPEYLPYKEHVLVHVDRLKRLMQDLLELGKPIEKSKIVSRSIVEIIKESVSLWKSSGLHEKAEVVLELDPEENLFVMGDPLKLQQVFVNLLENASQHSPEGSEITIVLGKRGKIISIGIIDRGIGIKKEIMGRIFEPFFTTRKKGTGLGLSIVKHIIEVHEGTITLRNNEPPPGCTVEVLLPSCSDLSLEDQNEPENSSALFPAL